MPVSGSNSESEESEVVDDIFARIREEQGHISKSRSDQQQDNRSTSDSSETDTSSDSDFDIGPRHTYNLNFGQYASSSSSNGYAPWTSKAMFLADLIMNSKRLKFSRRQMRVLLAYARETQGDDIPSLKTIKKMQQTLKKKLGNPTIRKISPNGNVFYINQIGQGIARDLANPYLHRHMNFYPHFDNKQMSQVWHGTKMLASAPDHLLTPMVRYKGRIFYINELVRCNGDWFLPLRWVFKGKHRELCAVGHKVVEGLSGMHICSDRRSTVSVSTFSQSLPELLKQGIALNFDEQSQLFHADKPHPLREIAGSRPVYSVPIIIFMDDVSGNMTKQWNKHISCYISNGALPREILHSEYCVQFVLTSKHADASELMHGIREDLRESFKHPVIAFDCEAQEEVLIQLYPLFSSADNPMQAEQCSCQLQNANIFCRTCHVGGTQEFKQSEAGYASLFRPGEKRTPAQTLERVNTLLEMATQPSQKTRIKDQARDWGIRDSLGQSVIDKLLNMGHVLRTTSAGGTRRPETEVISMLRMELDYARRQGCVNAFLDMADLGFNVHEDTPTEILHTILLGVVKYFWGQTVFVVSKAHHMHTLEIQLGSVDPDGLNIDSIGEKYMCQYTGSLIGKHFKTLAQVMPFACYNIVPGDLLEVWLLIGRLTSLLWYTEIDNIDVYLAELQAIIDDFLLATARCSPSIIVHKPKFHFLVHLPMYIQRFGPAILFSTERFESFHGVFRAGSLFSNHHAPSRDIAEYFVGLDRLKHICSGGYWQEGNCWVQAGPFVRNFVSENKEFSALIGFPKARPSPGGVNGLPKSLARLHRYKQWDTFSADKTIFPSAAPLPGRNLYFHVLSIVSRTGDMVRAGSNILFQSKFGQVTALFGCASPDGTIQHFVSVKQYLVAPTKHPLFDMPSLQYGGDICCIPVQDVICLVNIQHNCGLNGRCLQQKFCERQEREDTTRARYRIQHSSDGQFVLNTFGLHNIVQVQRALPRSLASWRGLNVDSAGVHRDAIRKLALASTNKTLQAQARRVAKSAFSSVVEHGLAASDSESQLELPIRGTKRRRTANESQNPTPVPLTSSRRAFTLANQP